MTCKGRIFMVYGYVFYEFTEGACFLVNLDTISMRNKLVKNPGIRAGIWSCPICGTRGQTLAMIPPTKIPRKAANLFIYLEYRHSKRRGPKEDASPDQAKRTNV